MQIDIIQLFKNLILAFQYDKKIKFCLPYYTWILNKGHNIINEY